MAYNLMRGRGSYNICTEKGFFSGLRAGQIADHSNKLSRIDLACIVQLCTGHGGDPRWWFIFILVVGALSPSPITDRFSYVPSDEFNPHASFFFFKQYLDFDNTVQYIEYSPMNWYMILKVFWSNLKISRKFKNFYFIFYIAHLYQFCLSNIYVLKNYISTYFLGLNYCVLYFTSQNTRLHPWIKFLDTFSTLKYIHMTNIIIIK